MIELHSFFTFWVFILVIFHKYTHKIFSLPYLTFIVFTTSIYISYIEPAAFYVRYDDKIYEINGYKKIILDIIFHFSVFIFIYSIYGFEPFLTNWKIISSLILILIYIFLYNPSEIYFL